MLTIYQIQNLKPMKYLFQREFAVFGKIVYLYLIVLYSTKSLPFIYKYEVHINNNNKKKKL